MKIKNKLHQLKECRNWKKKYWKNNISKLIFHKLLQIQNYWWRFTTKEAATGGFRKKEESLKEFLPKKFQEESSVTEAKQ